MRFDLSDSPFRNIHKYHDDDVLDYLESRLREFAWHHHEQKKAAVPPCAFVFGETHGSFVLGYAHTTPGSFIEQVKYEARHLKARRVVLMSEVNSMSAPNEAALLAVEVQAPGRPSLRCAYDLLGPGRVPILDDWTLPSVDEKGMQELQKLDPVVQMVEQASQMSRLLGLSLFFCPVFPNPSDSGAS
jgi:hypothetical protein